MFSSDLCTVSVHLTSSGPWVVFFCCKGSWLGKFPSCSNWSCQVNSSKSLGACFCFQLAGKNALSFPERAVGKRWSFLEYLRVMPCPTSFIVKIAMWSRDIRKSRPMVYLKESSLCREVRGTVNQSIPEIAAEFTRGHHWGYLLFLQVQVGIETWLLSLLPAWSEALLQRLLVWKPTYVVFIPWHKSLPWETQLGLQQCHRAPNSLKRSHHKVLGVSSVCLGVLQGAKDKLCISRQVLIFQIQSSTSSVEAAELLLKYNCFLSKWAVMILWLLFLCEKTSESGQSMKMYLCPLTWWKPYTHEMSNPVYDT